MSNQKQIQEVQQQINVVLEEVSEMNITPAAAEHADNGEKVRFLRKRLLQLGGRLEKLDENKNRLLRAQEVSTNSLSPVASSYIASTIKYSNDCRVKRVSLLA